MSKVFSRRHNCLVLCINPSKVLVRYLNIWRLWNLKRAQRRFESAEMMVVMMAMVMMMMMMMVVMMVVKPGKSSEEVWECWGAVRGWFEGIQDCKDHYIISPPTPGTYVVLYIQVYVDIYHLYVGLSIPASSRSYFEQSDQDSRLRNSIPDTRLHCTPVHQHQLLQQLLPETHLEFWLTRRPPRWAPQGCRGGRSRWRWRRGRAGCPSPQRGGWSLQPHRELLR